MLVVCICGIDVSGWHLFTVKLVDREKLQRVVRYVGLLSVIEEP